MVTLEFFKFFIFRPAYRVNIVREFLNLFSRSRSPVRSRMSAAEIRLVAVVSRLSTAAEPTLKI